MSFTKHHASFGIWTVQGDRPLFEQRDNGCFSLQSEELFATLNEHAFEASQAPALNSVECGFCGGAHLLDGTFNPRKNIFGDHAYFAVRVDTHAAPAQLKTALKQREIEAVTNGHGKASKGEKADAAEEAVRILQREAKDGKYRKSKLAFVLWNIPTGRLYCSATSNAMLDPVVDLMRRAFGIKFSPVTPGSLAAGLVAKIGSSARALEDARPSPFIEHPTDPKEKYPGIPWMAGARDLRDFLGNEFLLWAASQPGEIGDIQFTPYGSLTVECAYAIGGRATFVPSESGSPLRDPDCRKAIASGKWPRKMGLMIADHEHGFELNLHGDHWEIGAKLPEDENANSDREVAEHSLTMMLKAVDLLERLYEQFLHHRLSPSGGWEQAGRPAVSKWLAGLAPGDGKAPSQAMLEKIELSQKLMEAYEACKAITKAEAWDGVCADHLHQIQTRMKANGENILVAATRLQKAERNKGKAPYFLAAAAHSIIGEELERRAPTQSVMETVQEFATKAAKGESTSNPKADKALKKLRDIGRKEGGSVSIKVGDGPEIQL